MKIDESKITRVELIDDTGRAYSAWGINVELYVQDGEKTLKVFVYNKQKTDKPVENK